MLIIIRLLRKLFQIYDYIFLIAIFVFLKKKNVVTHFNIGSFAIQNLQRCKKENKLCMTQHHIKYLKY